MLEEGISYPLDGDNALGRIVIGSLLIFGFIFVVPVFLLYGYLVRVLVFSFYSLNCVKFFFHNKCI
ncbi:hypothetical protein C8039_12585 [Halogeometricum sp. wsp3]|nr:hypothetical protein C8039_12585 [Halogeometricum sp. wsp3]